MAAYDTCACGRPKRNKNARCLACRLEARALLRPAPERFWAKVDKGVGGAGHGPKGCWLWTGAVFGDTGYGCFSPSFERRNIGAHRYALELTHGTPPVGETMHTCDVRLCVRPDHLVDGTHTANMQDMAAKGRWKNQARCGSGHPSQESRS